jgi:hypothetical protein
MPRVHGVNERIKVDEIGPSIAFYYQLMTNLDAVAWIPGTDGIVVTSLEDPRDPEGSAQREEHSHRGRWRKGRAHRHPSAIA